MDVRITISSGGGKKVNSSSHSTIFKEVQSMEQVIECFKVEFGQFFPKYATLDKMGEGAIRKERRKGNDGKSSEQG